MIYYDLVLTVWMNRCGLFAEDWGEPSFEKVGTHYRLDSILIRGINRMSTEEIFSYLFEIGLVPQAMEWVNDACCKFLANFLILASINSFRLFKYLIKVDSFIILLKSYVPRWSLIARNQGPSKLSCPEVWVS